MNSIGNIRIIREIFTTFRCERCKRDYDKGLNIGLLEENIDRKYNLCNMCYTKIIEKYREIHEGVCSISNV